MWSLLLSDRSVIQFQNPTHRVSLSTTTYFSLVSLGNGPETGIKCYRLHWNKQSQGRRKKRKEMGQGRIGRRQGNMLLFWPLYYHELWRSTASGPAKASAKWQGTPLNMQYRDICPGKGHQREKWRRNLSALLPLLSHRSKLLRSRSVVVH